MVMKCFGVLALQGDYAAHAATLRTTGVEVQEIRRCAELEQIVGLVIPGGESTTLLKLMDAEPWFEALRSYHKEGGAILGTCAGAILLSRTVIPRQPSLGLLDVSIERNAYGRQIDSFETPVSVPVLKSTLDAVFIRAPRFRQVGSGVEVLASLDGDPVLVREGGILAATFHPELTRSPRLHQFFIEMAEKNQVEKPTSIRKGRPGSASASIVR
jgi:5'-phosphate synthase pdxT subunit